MRAEAMEWEGVDLIGIIIISALGGAVVALAATAYWNLSVMAAILVYGLVGAAVTLMIGLLQATATHRLQKQLMGKTSGPKAGTQNRGLQLDRIDPGGGQ